MPLPHYLTLPDPFNPAQSRHLAYYIWGDITNPRTVICLHGLSRNGRDFDFLAQSLSSRWRVICPDMAGRGKSDRFSNPAGYNYATYITDCTVLMNTLGITCTVWIGTSMGGIVGMMLAASAPDRIQSLVLNDVGSTVSAAGLKRILAYVGASGPFASEAEAMSNLRSNAATFGITSEAEWKQMFEASFDRLPDGRYVFAYDPAITQPLKGGTAETGSAIVDIDLSAFWQQVQCPALILRGEKSDILTRATAEAMCRRAAPTKLVEIPGAGHAPALLDDGQIQIVANWLDQLA